MKVEGPSKSGGTQKSGKAKSVGKTSSKFDDMLVGGTEKTSAASPVQSVASVDALLAVQGVDNPTERAARRRMHERGDKILQQLDGLKLSLLSGNLTVGQVVNIADMVASHREKINDPDMSALLDEIDLRAQIELAKIRKAMDQAQ
jgi:hypothetical protein